MSLSEGSLVSPVNDTLGFSKVMFSFSAASNLPGFLSALPFRPFFNLSVAGNRAAIKQPSILYEAGLIAGIRNFFELYIPVQVSPYINNNLAFRERIRFVLTLNTPISLPVK
jgi:hypothetical protein